jgi:hypothetical protein
MAAASSNTGTTAGGGKTGGGGTTSGGNPGGGSSGGSDGIYYDDNKLSGQVEAYSYLGNNNGVPPTLTEVVLADGNYYGSYPDQAVAEQNQTYFAYFNGLGGMGPEIIDQTAYFIKYIIDTQGNVVNPEPGINTSRDQAVGLYNLIDNFEVGKRAIVKQIEYDPTLSVYKNTSGVHTITGVGFLENIAVTEIGLTPESYTPTMSFNFEAIPYEVGNMFFTSYWYPPSNTSQPGIDSTIGEVSWPEVSTRVRISFNPSDNGVDFNTAVDSTLRVPFNNITTNGGSWETTGLTGPSDVGKFRCLSGSAESRTRIRFKTSIAVATFAIGQICRIFVVKNGVTIFQSSPLIIPSLSQTGYPGYQQWTSDWYQDYAEGDIFEIKIQKDPAYGTFTFIDATAGNFWGQPFIFATDEGLGAGGNFVIIEQETPPNSQGADLPDAIPGYNTAYAPYFVTCYNITSSYSSSGVVNPNASYSLLVLTPQFSSIFRSNQTQTINSASQSGIDGMNFNKCTIPLGQTQAGDFIRFEYNKNNVRLITGVDYWYNFVSGSTLYGDEYIVWKISPPLGTTPTGSVMTLNHFNMYRMVNNGNYIILDVPRTDKGVFSSGILQPEYSSDELINNYNKIITTLTEKETIN